MKDIDEVEVFLEEFFLKEYELALSALNVEGERSSYMEKVYAFFDKYMIPSVESYFSHLTAWRDDEDESSRKNEIENIRRRRKLFVIERYADAKYDSMITEDGFTDTLFVCYASDNSQIANNEYFKRISISTSDSDFKIIAVEQATDRGWKEYKDFRSVLDFGEFEKAKKVQAPIDEGNLKHYDAL